MLDEGLCKACSQKHAQTLGPNTEKVQVRLPRESVGRFRESIVLADNGISADQKLPLVYDVANEQGTLRLDRASF